MDNQGFTANGMGVTNAAGFVQPGAAAIVPGRKVRIAANDVVGTVHGAMRPDSDEAHIAGMRKLQNVTDRVTFTGEFIGMIGGGALGWVASAFRQSKAATVVHAIFSAPFEAMRTTKLNNLFELPANYMRSVAKHANESAIKGAKKAIKSEHKGLLTNDEIQELIGKKDFKTYNYEGVKGTGSHKWVESATQKADALEASGKKMARDVGDAIEPVTKGLRKAVKSGLESFESTAVGKSVERRVQQVAEWRAERVSAKYTKHLDKAHAALTTESVSWDRRIWNFLTGKKPATLDPHPALAEVTGHLNSARAATTPAERVLHTETASKLLEPLMALEDKTLGGRVGKLAKTIGKSHSAAKVLHGFEGVKSTGLTGAVKALGHAAGRVPLFGAILGVSAVAGVSATLLTHKHENKLAREAHDEILATIGAHNPLMQVIEQAQRSNGYKHVAKTSLSAVGEVANAAMGMDQHGAGLAMMGAVMLPMAGAALIKENALLNAYANLRQEEKSGKPMEAADKVECIKQLIAYIPSVAAHGGYYNRLTGPVAEAISDKNLSAADTMKLLANEQQFTAFAAKVQEDQRALAAPAPKVAPVAAKNMPQRASVPTPVMPAPVPATNPVLRVNDVHHEGRVADIQKVASL